jgi:rhodanese-related sulfurtransferase
MLWSNPMPEPDLEVSPQEVVELVKNGQVTLIDVRTPQEFAIARIEGSRLVDEALLREILEKWPKDKPIVTICHHGIRSLDAAVYLRRQGFTKTRSMHGGTDLWSQIVDPNVPRY